MLLLPVVVACSDDTRLTVLAASSLTDAFDDLASAFETAHPGVSVTVSVAGSQTLAMQVEQGLNADVFASADTAHVERLVAAGLAVEPQPFATNGLVLVSPTDSPTEVTLATLPQVERLVLAAPEVPLGQYTDALLAAGAEQYGATWSTGVQQSVVSREPNARLVTAKVVLGEADAAIVYATDARDGLRVEPVPAAPGTRATYAQARLSDTAESRSWTAFVLSEPGQRILAEHGFGAPP